VDRTGSISDLAPTDFVSATAKGTESTKEGWGVKRVLTWWVSGRSILLEVARPPLWPGCAAGGSMLRTGRRWERGGLGQGSSSKAALLAGTAKKKMER
jgi:hypothetical protein